MQGKTDFLIPAGKLFCFSEGEYSNYGYVGHFLALEPINTATWERAKERCHERIKAGGIERYGETVTMQSKEYKIRAAVRDLFIPELVRMGVVMSIDCAEVFLGSYGRLEI